MHPARQFHRVYDPTGISEAALIAGTVVSVAAAGAGAAASYQSAQYNSKVAANNAQAATDQANYTTSLKQIQLEKTLGQERAAAGASGVTGGSSDDVTYNSLVQGKYDQLATTYQAKVAGTRDASEEQLDQMQGNNALVSGGISALGAATKGYSQYSGIQSNTAGVGEQPDFDF